ncbi:FHA domain-containing protein [Verrucomicrobia bacterium]|nr:FHA domain-containing protein [Verrucomicrobiota bacterium]MDB4459159.1 FHA domain-containing protein [bacterium]
MIQLQILSGRQQGTMVPIVGFPFSIGRAGSDSLRLQEPGIWEHHAVIDTSDGMEFQMKTRPNATLLVNSEPSECGALIPGDVLELGDLRLRFELDSPQQRTNTLREGFFWAILLLVLVIQIGLVVILR